MDGTYLLDTNAAVGLLNLDPNVEQVLSEANEVFACSTVLGELYFGAEKSGRVQSNLAKVDDLAARYVVLGADEDTARWYGRIKNELRAKGRPIPENDIWIAAIAQQYELTVLTRDKHFDNIEGLSLQDW